MPRTDEPYFRVATPIELRLRPQFRDAISADAGNGQSPAQRHPRLAVGRPDHQSNSHQELLDLNRTQGDAAAYLD